MVSKKETLKEANYKMVKSLGGGRFILYNIDADEFEEWFANKNHASYGLIYKNTHLEFAMTLPKPHKKKEKKEAFAHFSYSWGTKLFLLHNQRKRLGR